MMTKDRIAAAIEALQPAPAGESMQQIAVRAAHWLLGTIEDAHPEIAQTRLLYSRCIDDGGLGRPTETEWQANIDALALALDLARALALALARALALALALALARVVIRLLGDRLHVLPALNRQVLSAVESTGCQLVQAAYHTCETAHCRAGWAITLHPLGRELEAAFGSEIAGSVIYLSSTGKVPNFFDMDEDRVLADIRACAAAEQS